MRLLLGFFVLSCVLSLWIGASVLIQTLLFSSTHFAKPVFTTLSQCCLAVLFIIPSICRWVWGKLAADRGASARSSPPARELSIASETSDGDQPPRMNLTMADSSLPERDSRLTYPDGIGPSSAESEEMGDQPEKFPSFSLAVLALPFGFFWFGLQVTFNAGLLGTSIPTSSVIAATSAFQIFVLSLWLLSERFNPFKLGAVALAFIGVITITLFQPTTTGVLPVEETWWGWVFSGLSSVLYSCFVVAIKLYDKELEEEISLLFGYIGLWCWMVGPALLLVCHVTGVETFELPGPKAAVYLLINGVFGTVLADYLWAWGILLLGPLLATVTLSLEMPCSLLLDWLVLKQHTFQKAYIVGLGLVVCGVFALTCASQQEPEGSAGKYSIMPRHDVLEINADPEAFEEEMNTVYGNVNGISADPR